MESVVSFTYRVQSAVEEHITHKDTAGRIIMVVAQLPAGPHLHLASLRLY